MRKFVAALAATVLALAAVATAAAQDGGGGIADKADLSDFLFSWAYAQGGFSGNWQVGLALGLAGAAGGLVSVYLFLGEFLPSMGSKGEYEAGRLDLEERRQRRDRLLELRDQHASGRLGADALVNSAALNALTADLPAHH